MVRPVGMAVKQVSKQSGVDVSPDTEYDLASSANSFTVTALGTTAQISLI